MSAELSPELKEELPDDFYNECDELPGNIRSQLTKLEHALTRDLLAFSKIARQDVQLAPVDLDEVVHEILAEMPALSAIMTVHSPLGRVMAQRTLLQQCISNLFDNALKFARPDVAPRVYIRVDPSGKNAPDQAAAGAAAAFIPSILSLESDRPPTSAADPGLSAAVAAAASRVCIKVKDNGIGIPVQAHEKIFGIFERVSNANTVEGTGIGLAIVARAMQQMGGSCGVQSTLDEGSTFWLELAAAPPSQT